MAGLKPCVSSKSWRSFWRILKFENHWPKWSGITLPALRSYELKHSKLYVSLSFLLNCKLFERKKWAWNLINCQYFLLCVASNEGVSIIKILHKLGYLINNYVFLNVNDLFPVSLYCIWYIIHNPRSCDDCHELFIHVVIIILILTLSGAIREIYLGITMPTDMRRL